MKTHDFLLELGTEELPPNLLVKLSNTLRDNLVKELNQLGIAQDSRNFSQLRGEMGINPGIDLPKPVGIFPRFMENSDE